MEDSTRSSVRPVTRRAVARGIAWTAPAVVMATTAPAFAASPQPELTSTLWFSGHGTTTNYASTCSVPDYRSASGACGTPTSYYPWRHRFQFYGTDDAIRSDAGTCYRDSSIAISHLDAGQITGPITLTFWRPEDPAGSDDIRTWYPGANDSSLWSVPVRTATPPQSPFGGTFSGLRMYEYQTTLSMADARAMFASDGAGGITLSLTSATAALSFFSDCLAFDYTYTDAYLRAYSQLGRYRLTVPTTRGDLVKDTGFYTS